MPISFYIIIPIYNVESHLSKCLTSIINQTYGHFEAILVDDGSTDGSLKIAQDYANKDGRFTLITQKNQGQSVARNTALDFIKQKWLNFPKEQQNNSYVWFVDSDDFVEEFALEHLTRLLIQNLQTDILITNYFFINYPQANQDFITPQPLVPKECDNKLLTPHELAKLAPNNLITTTVGYIHKASHLFGKDIKFITPHILHQDIAFCTHSVLSANQIYVDNTPLYHYVQSDNSTMRTQMDTTKHRKRAFAYFTLFKYLQSLKINFDDKDIINHLDNSCFWLFNHTLQHLRMVGYKDIGFSKNDLLEFSHYAKNSRRKLCIYFPRAYNIPQRIKNILKS